MAAILKKNDVLDNSSPTRPHITSVPNPNIVAISAQETRYDLRQAMRLTVGAVSVITTGDEQNRTGATVTSANSFSIEPEEMMVALNLNSSTWKAIQKFNSFCINYLDEKQLFLADQFSGKSGHNGIERYQGADWQKLSTGAPVLSSALIAIDCSLSEVIIRNSHALIFGEVRGILTNEGSPLLFQAGIYKTLNT